MLVKALTTDDNDIHSRPFGSPEIEENGRQYQGFRRGIYPFPCDEAEKDRLDMFHELFLMARNRKLHARQLPPVKGRNRLRILDLGTGTGIWAVEMAERYPGIDVVGVDISNIQPPMIPRNVRFHVPFDFESFWFFGEEKPWDFIHLRCALGSVSSWAALYQNIYQRLRPGIGIFEQVEIDLEPRCNDGQKVPENHPVRRWFKALLEATTRAGRSIGWREDYHELLTAQGYGNIETEVIKLPITLRAPPHDLKSQRLSQCYNEGLAMSLEALTIGPFTQSLGWSADQVRGLVKELEQNLRGGCDMYMYNSL
ncbi:hypothetical protein MMC31_003578 [Peltigera leucophlebia]|nr:hypothetical protein [Peltigera leucophlebia]